MAKILVTGGNGFLGSWIVRRLCEQGHQVTCLLRPTSNVSELAGLSFSRIEGDVTDYASVEKACTGQEFVFHLAGLIAYRRAERENMDKVNVGGTENVIQGCLKKNVGRLVHLSSVVAVGASFDKRHILNEDSEFNLHQLNLGYFESKRNAEKLVVQACKEHQLDAVILNPSTIYGASDARKGSRKTQIKVARGEFPFYTAGGVSVIPVENCVNGILAGWQKGRKGERYILCSENLTIRQLFTMIAEAAGVEPPRIKLPSVLLHVLGFTGDLMTQMGMKSSLSQENAWTATLYHWFDSSKAQRELGFVPGSAKVAIQNSVQWMKDQGLLWKAAK